jgi:hypothetical protein
VRTFPLRFGYLRQQPINNWDLSALKNIGITERLSLQFRAEFLNAFNHAWYGRLAPTVDPVSTAFGSVAATHSVQDNYPRRIQLSMKFLF